MKYFISAGEASGDLHASHLMTALKENDPEATFDFLGGDLMAAAAGHAPLIHYRDMAFMGFVDVVRNLGKVTGNLKTARAAIEKGRPQAVVLVDYPSFNLRLAKWAHALDIPVYYYISPKVWAWKEGRVKSIKKYVKKMYSILPFEVDFYRDRHGYDVMYVGNPSAEEIDARRRELPSREEFLSQHGLTDKPLLALVPGSRVSEIRNNLAIMAGVAARHPQFQPVITAAPAIDKSLYGTIAPGIAVIDGATFDTVAHAAAALVTSGTATLEAALLGTPQVVCFRHGGSRLVYNMYKRLLKIPYVSLPNLIANEPVVPEMLMHLCTVDSVDYKLCDILPGEPGREKMLEGYALMRRKLGDRHAADTTAADMVADLGGAARD